MSDWIQTAFLGGSLRFAEALLSAMPTLMIGLMIAAVLRFYLGVSGTQRLFGGPTMRSLPQAWAVGMLLPVCSIGVLPILIEMRRAKLKAGAMSAFALSAPLFNPLSLLYGVTLSRPFVILMFAFGSLVVVTLVGMIWDRFSVSQKDPASDTVGDDVSAADSLIGVRRLLAAIAYACRQLVGPVGALTLIAAFGVLLLASVLPWGALGHAMGRDDLAAPARMASIAIPIYATPMLAMGQLGMMFQHANSPGAAFILLVVGAGVNVGTLVWMSWHFGLRSVVIWLSCLMTVVVAIAYAVNEPLIPPGVNPSGHTHAFDVYSNPIHSLDSNTGSFAQRKLSEKFGLMQQICLSVFAVMGVIGVVAWFLGIQDEWFLKKQGLGGADSQQPTQDALEFDRIVGPQVVGATLIGGLVALSVVMCFAFYPSPEECMEEIRFIRADAMTAAMSGDAEHAKFWIPRWDQWSRRMEVGAFIRYGHVTPYQRMQGYLLRSKLDLLEHELDHEHDDASAIRELALDIMSTDTRLRISFRDPYRKASDVDQAPAATISQDTDVEHQHRHSHDGKQSHDHDHDDFHGTHQHGHQHGHRHDDSPHGGRVISVKSTGHPPRPHHWHVEVLPIQDGRVVVYPLAESESGFEPTDDRPGSLVIRFNKIPNDQQSIGEIELEWDAADKKFHASLHDHSADASILHDAQITGELKISGQPPFTFNFSVR